VKDYHYEASPPALSWARIVNGDLWYFKSPHSASEPSRRIVVYDPSTGKFHAGSFYVFPWIMRAYTYVLWVENFQTYYESYWEEVPEVFLKFYGGFIISDITVDVSNLTVTLNGSTSWLETPWEGLAYDAASTDFGGFSSSLPVPTINFINDNLPNAEIVAFDTDGNEAASSIIVTPAEYTDVNFFALDVGTKSVERPLYVKRRLISEKLINYTYYETYTSEEYACMSSLKHVTKNISIIPYKFRPWYVMDIPSDLAPLMKDGKLYYRILDFNPKFDGNGIFIPRIDWLDAGGNIYAVQSPTTPDQINDKPDITSITLKNSSLDLPSYAEEVYSMSKALPVDASDEFSIIMGEDSRPYGGFGDPSKGVIVGNEVLMQSSLIQSRNWEFTKFIIGNTSTSLHRYVDSEEIIEAWIKVGENIVDFTDLDVTPYLYTSTEGQAPNADVVNVGYNKVTFKPPGVIYLEADRRIYDFDRLEILNPETDELIRTIPGTQLVKEDPYPYVGFTLLQSDFDACGGQNPKLRLYAIRVLSYYVCFRVGDFFSIYWKTGDLQKAIEYGVYKMLPSNHLYSEWSYTDAGDGFPLSVWSENLFGDSVTAMIPVPIFGSYTEVDFPDCPDDPIIPHIRTGRPTWTMIGVEKWVVFKNSNADDDGIILWHHNSICPWSYEDNANTSYAVGTLTREEIESDESGVSKILDLNFSTSNMAYYQASNGKFYGIIDDSEPEVLKAKHTIAILKTDKLLLQHNLQTGLINPNKIV